LAEVGHVAELRESEATCRDDTHIGCWVKDVTAEASGEEVRGCVNNSGAASGTWK